MAVTAHLHAIEKNPIIISVVLSTSEKMHHNFYGVQLKCFVVLARKSFGAESREILINGEERICIGSEEIYALFEWRVLSSIH